MYVHVCMTCTCITGVYITRYFTHMYEFKINMHRVHVPYTCIKIYLPGVISVM